MTIFNVGHALHDNLRPSILNTAPWPRNAAGLREEPPGLWPVRPDVRPARQPSEACVGADVRLGSVMRSMTYTVMRSMTYAVMRSMTYAVMRSH